MARRWQASEDAEFARLYAQQLPLRVIAQRLGRSEEALTARRKLLGIAPRRARPRWSEQQDTVLVLAARAGIPATEIARQQGRPVQQIRTRRAQLLGTRAAARRYQPWEDEAIKAAWSGATDVRDLALRLGRSPDAVRLRARSLGLYEPVSRRRWSRDEDHVLRDGYSVGLSCEEIKRSELPRSTGAIAARARKLGLTSYARLWSPEEDDRLALLRARGVPIDQIALALTRTPDAVRQRSRKLAMAPPRAGTYAQSGSRWKPSEDEMLRANPGAHPSMLSKLLDRSDHSIRQRQRALGIRTGSRSPHNAPVSPREFSPAEDRMLRRELWPAARGSRLLTISARLIRTPGELQRRTRQLQGGNDPGPGRRHRRPVGPA